jgi:hypothetical protein
VDAGAVGDAAEEWHGHGGDAAEEWHGHGGDAAEKRYGRGGVAAEAVALLPIAELTGGWYTVESTR